MEVEMEVKADALDGAFDAVLAAEAVDDLKASVAALKAQVDAQAVAASRLPLDGAKAADPARDAFVERYLRRGIDAGVEMKSLSGATGGEGGFAVPREIDGSIAETLKSLSPIRSIATVVQTGTSGYRKLVATGAMGARWGRAGSARPRRGPKPRRAPLPKLRRRRASFTPIRQRARRCWTMRCSTSRTGWPTSWGANLRSPRAARS